MSFTKKQLLPGEKLVVLAHQHVLVLFWPVFLNLMALAILIALAIMFQPWWIALYIAPLAHLFWAWMTWRRREYILTSRRVVKQEGVFAISSFDATLDKINNVFHQQNLMGRLLKFGDVGLETASEKGTTIFNFLSRPIEFKNSIVRQRELYKTEAAAAYTSPPTNIPQLLEDLAALRDRNIITSAEFEEKKKALLAKL
jgi:uncharacterized membrane protein YdbT with pleckstrin-like domain